jgi:hypothetical protein
VTRPKIAYSVAEAAGALGISQEQVKREIRAGKLQAVRTSPLEEKPSGAFRGGKLLITWESMREWLDGLEVA